MRTALSVCVLPVQNSTIYLICPVLTRMVRAVLDEYGSGGLVDTWDQTDQPRAILESREDPRFNQSGMINCLQFQGNVQGKHLLDIGFSPVQITDQSRDYHIQAWLIGTHVIKAQLTPSPSVSNIMSHHLKVPGTPVGNGLPDILTDITTVANATLRALVNNLSIASGPQVIVNDDRLSDRERWKTYIRSDGMSRVIRLAIIPNLRYHSLIRF